MSKLSSNTYLLERKREKVFCNYFLNDILISLGYSQMISLPVSLFSLVIASSKLYYSQQLGDFSVSDPSLTMIAKVSPLNIILLLGNLCSIIIITSYFQQFVLGFIGLVIVSNYIILKLKYMNQTQKNKIPTHNKKHNQHHTNQPMSKKRGGPDH